MFSKGHLELNVKTRIESNDPMFKSHNEEKVTTLCSNNEESTYVFLRTLEIHVKTRIESNDPMFKSHNE